MPNDHYIELDWLHYNEGRRVILTAVRAVLTGRSSYGKLDKFFARTQEVYLNTPAQLSLPLYLPDDETFASFYPGENGVLLAAVQEILSRERGSYLYFWSRKGGGRSHLLHAACAALSAGTQAVGYVPLDKRSWFIPEVLEGMEQLALVTIDNIECIVSDPPWEMAIFNLYNRIQETGRTRLIISGNCPPRQLNLRLPDLASRLDWGQIYRLQPLSDEEKGAALQLRAKLHGFELPEDVCRFLLKRLERDMRTLSATLDQLGHASIRAQRRLTIPFVKAILNL